MSIGAVAGAEPAPAARAEPRTGIELSDLLARFSVGVLFVLLSLNLLADFMRTHRLTGLLLLVSESLVVVFTIARRRATFVDRSRAAALVAVVSMVGPPLLRAGDTPPLLPDAATALLSALGLSLGIAGKLVLGRSFGIVPANRGVVVRGPYLLVRHPIYAGYLLTHVGFVLAQPQIRNIAVVLISDVALGIRAIYEERTLLKDDRYREYCARVRYRLVPGLI